MVLIGREKRFTPISMQPLHHRQVSLLSGPVHGGHRAPFASVVMQPLHHGQVSVCGSRVLRRSRLCTGSSNGANRLIPGGCAMNCQYRRCFPPQVNSPLPQNKYLGFPRGGAQLQREGSPPPVAISPRWKLSPMRPPERLMFVA